MQIFIYYTFIDFLISLAKNPLLKFQKFFYFFDELRGDQDHCWLDPDHIIWSARLLHSVSCHAKQEFCPLYYLSGSYFKNSYG